MAILVLTGCAKNNVGSADGTNTGTVADGADLNTGETSAASGDKPHSEVIYGTVGDNTGEPLEYVDGIYKITEENYINGVFEVYRDPGDYIGERIEFEGVYVSTMINSQMFYQVYRTLEIGCGDDENGHHHHAHEEQMVGFIIQYDGDKPKDNSFVHVSGKVDTISQDEGDDIVIVKADVLEVCDEPGILIYKQ